MKFYVVSDIHGSSKNLKRVLEYFDEDGDYLVVLGDILYHGPRNPLPEEYNPQEVMALLNARKEKILAVRGNCDGEVDQMVLDFPITSDYLMLPFHGYKIFVTHGHLYDDCLSWLSEKDAVLFGHIHVPMAFMHEGHVHLNPGSISLPKNNSCASFGILEDDEFKVVDLDKKVIMSHKFVL